MSADLRISGAQTTPRSESDIRVNFNNPSRIIAAANAIGASNQAQFYSTDGGVTWNQTTLPLIAGDSLHSDPTVDWTSNGTAWATTIGINAAQTVLQIRAYKSTNNGATWTFDGTITGVQTAADKQMMWVDHSPTSPHRDTIYVIWHNNSPVFVNRRTGPAGAWQTPLQVSGAETTGTGIGGDIKTNSAGDVFAFWPDTGSRGLFVAKSTDGGVSFGAPVRVATTFDSYDIGMPSFASRRALIYVSGGAYRTATKNLVYAVWTDQTGVPGCNAPGNEPGTNVASNCKTRVWFARSTDGGATWGAATMLNNQASRNDQFNPWLAVDETNGQLVVMYYDTVGDPGRKRTDVWVQTSPNDGVTWTTARKVTSAQTDETSAGTNSGNQYGDYNGLSGYAGRFFPCWTDRRSGGKEEIWTAPVTTSAPTIKFVDDGGTSKFFDDGGTLKFVEDGGTSKFADDKPPTVKFTDDGGSLKFVDEKAAGLDQGKPAGLDQGVGAPGGPMQAAGGAGAPFILATPHHSMAWAGFTAAQQAPQQAPPMSAAALIPQYEAALAQLQQAMQASADTLQQLDTEYRRILTEYQALVASRSPSSGP